MSERQSFYCEIGKHNWARESKRGRPPRNCPEHQPEKPEIKTIIRHETVTGAKTLAELVPGIEQYLEPEKRVLWCEHGEGHEWEAPRRRGRQPRFCPEHSQQGQVVRRVEVIERNREKEREELQEKIERLTGRVLAASLSDDQTYQQFIQTHDDDTFKSWMRTNSRLLGECEALRASERKLETLS